MIIEQIWPQWKVEGEIGRGSYGVVYKCCRDNNGTKEYAAIKVISMDSGLDSSFTDISNMQAYEEVINEIKNEAKLLNSLKGAQNIVQIKDSASLETENGFYFLIRMDLLNGFEQYVSERTIKESDVRKLGLDLCSALIDCHENDIIHRDIKPKNILVDAEGNYELSDFGVAKKLEGRGYASSLKGNYEFMAPEVIHEHRSEALSDVYSLGLVMYWLLNGCTLPFVPRDGVPVYSDYKKAFDKRMSGAPLPKIKGVSKAMNQIVLKACQYKPENRYHSAAEFKQALTDMKSTVDWKLLVKIMAVILAVVLCSFGSYKVYDYFKNNSNDLSLEGIKIHFEDEYIDPIPIDVSEHHRVGKWGYFLYKIEKSFENEDEWEETEEIGWETEEYSYPVLFRYSTKDRIAESVTEQACLSYQIEKDSIFCLLSSPGKTSGGDLYLMRADGTAMKSLATRVRGFEIIDGESICFVYDYDGDEWDSSGEEYLQRCLWRMNLDGSKKERCAYPVSASIDGKEYYVECQSFIGSIQDGWVDCGPFMLELNVQEQGQERLIVKDAADNDWVYYSTCKLMKIRKDGSERAVLDENDTDYAENYLTYAETYFNYYSSIYIEWVRNEYIEYVKDGVDCIIRTDGTGLERIADQ